MEEKRESIVQYSTYNQQATHNGPTQLQRTAGIPEGRRAEADGRFHASLHVPRGPLFQRLRAGFHLRFTHL